MRALMLSNVRAGVGDPGTSDFLREIGEHDVEITLRFLRDTDDVAMLLRDAASFDRVIVSGGDGTVSSALYAMRDTAIPVALYPSGTANLFARNLSLPTDPVELARIAVRGTPVQIDLGELDCHGGRGFLVMAGIGFDAGLIERAQPLKPLIGEGAYVIAAFQDPVPKTAQIELDVDGTHIETEGIGVVLVNLARIQFDLPVTHGTDPRDGVFEVVVVKARSVAGLLPTVWAAVLDRVGDHRLRPGLEVYPAREVSVTSDPMLPLEADGEVIDCVPVLKARVLPRAATVLLPEGALV